MSLDPEADLPRLRVCGLGVAQGERALVRGVDFLVPAGRTHALLGPSGSGKSLTARALGRLLGPELTIEGEVWLRSESGEEIDLLRSRQKRPRNLAWIFQDPLWALHPLLRVETQLAEALGARPAMAREEMDLALKRVELAPAERILGSFPHQLSGGERQRVGLALALAVRPELLVADEPTASLDSVRALSFLELLRRTISERGMSLLLIAHEPAIPRVFDATVSLLENGRVSGSLPAPSADAEAWASAWPRLRPPLPGLRDSAPASSMPAERPGPEVLRLAGISKRWRNGPGPWRRRLDPVVAAEEVHLALHASECVAIVGASGAGKSTVARIATGLLEPSEGCVQWFGRTVVPASEPARRRERPRIQPVFQDPGSSLDPRWTAGAILEEARQVGAARGRAVAGTADLLAIVALPGEVATRPAGRLSGGQRQRVALARALATQPEVLVLDEAFSAVDRATAIHLIEALRTYRQRFGLAILLVAHDLEIVARLADSLLVMDGGRIVERGRPAEVLRRPAHAATQELVRAYRFLTGAGLESKGGG